ASLQSRRERSWPVLRVVSVQSSARSAAPCRRPPLKANPPSLYKLDEKKHPGIALSRDLGPYRTATANSEAKTVFSASVNGLIGHPPMDSTHPSHLLLPIRPLVDHAHGAEDAPYTLVEYGDYECPDCGRLYVI